MSALAFPICMLLAPQRQRRLNTDIQSQSTRDTIRDRLWKWLLGESAALWNAFRKIADPTRVAWSVETPEEVKKRVKVKLTQEAKYVKAIRTHLDVYEPSKQVLEALKMKHLQVRPATDADFPIVSSAPIIPAHKLFTEAELMQAVKKFPRGSSGSGTGITPNHLLKLLRTPRADFEKVRYEH